MTTVGVAQLKARLSEYLARVRAGDEIVVTDHGRPVARIVPAGGSDDSLADLERQGLVRVGSMRLPDGFLDAEPPGAGEAVTAALIEERRTGR